MWLSKAQIEISLNIYPESWKEIIHNQKSIHSCFEHSYILNKLFQIFQISSLIFAFHQLLYWMAVWFYRLFHNPFFSFSFFQFFFVFGFSCIQFLTTSNMFLYNFLTSTKIVLASNTHKHLKQLEWNKNATPINQPNHLGIK